MTTITLDEARLLDLLRGNAVDLQQWFPASVRLEEIPLPMRIRLIEVLTRDGRYQAGWLRSALTTTPEPGTPEWFAWIAANADRIDVGGGRFLTDQDEATIEQLLRRWIEAGFTPTVKR